MTQAFSDFGRVKHIHFVGIGGVGMSGIAEILHNDGYQVTGSDSTVSSHVERLQQLGVHIDIGHAPQASATADLLVISSAIQANNPELVAARERHCPVIQRAEMLAELMRLRCGIVIAGSHGKTTTTSLIASTLAASGLDPTYAIGGVLNQAGNNARLGKGKYLVAEADESDASFLHLLPEIAVVTNIDRDHLEAYGGDFEQLQQAFVEFLHRLPFSGLAIVCVDDPVIEQLVPNISRPLLTYGFSEEADIRALNTVVDGMSMQFDIAYKGEVLPTRFRVNLPGRHNVLNALAAFAVARACEIPVTDIASAFNEFAGVKRRLQYDGRVQLGEKEIELFEDYGHHPREIEVTLEALRAAKPGRRVVMVFQPHRYTRTQALFTEFYRVLSKVDALILFEVYSAGEAVISGADGKAICRSLEMRSRLVPILIANGPSRLTDLVEALTDAVQDGDLVLFQGAGDIGRIATGFREKIIEHGGCVDA